MNSVRVNGKEYRYKERINLGILAKVGHAESAIETVGIEWISDPASFEKVKAAWKTLVETIFVNSDDGLEYDVLLQSEVEEIRKGFLIAAGSKTASAPVASATSSDLTPTTP